MTKTTHKSAPMLLITTILKPLLILLILIDIKTLLLAWKKQSGNFNNNNMTTYYIYSNETNDQVDQITATTEFDANEKAEELWGSNDYHWSTCDHEFSNA